MDFFFSSNCSNQRTNFLLVKIFIFLKNKQILCNIQYSIFDIQTSSFFKTDIRQVFCTFVNQQCQLIKFLQEIFQRHQIEIKDIWFLFVFMKIITYLARNCKNLCFFCLNSYLYDIAKELKHSKCKTSNNIRLDQC